MSHFVHAYSFASGGEEEAQDEVEHEVEESQDEEEAAEAQDEEDEGFFLLEEAFFFDEEAFLFSEGAFLFFEAVDEEEEVSHEGGRSKERGEPAEETFDDTRGESEREDEKSGWQE